MKKFDYIVIQAPMISELGLKGNSLLLFAMIHGFSKDGVNRYRASLKDMCDWLCTSKSAISPVLNALVEAGYINKHDVEENGLSKPEYTTNYEALLKKAATEGSLKPNLVYKEKAAKSTRVRNPYPKQKAVESMGTESVLGTECVPNGYGIKNEIGTESVPNKYNINIYKYSSCCWNELTEEQKQQEQEEFFKMFFFRGAADPAAEVARFVAHNQVNGWQNKSGARYDSTEKRLSIAEFWEFKTGQRECKEFLKWWREVYEKVEAEVEAKVLLDTRIKIVTSDKENTFAINCTKKAQEFIEKNLDKVRDTFLAKAAGKRIIYIFLK
jgi:DNA-binding PadR family transcriptional regulator